MEKKHTQVVDFSNPNADKIISASTQTKMNNKKQSSIDFLLYHLPLSIEGQFKEQIEQAKAMHKEEIINAANNGCKGMCYLDSPREGQQYYEQTFGGQDNE